MLDVQAIRKDFPTITNDNVYLDSVASSLTPVSVIDEMTEYYYKYRANVHRGSYDLSMQASERYENAIGKIAKFVNANPSEIVITGNTTHSINEIALTLDFNEGDEVVLSSLEHSSNMVPWIRLQKKIGIKVRFYNPGKTGIFNINEFEKLLNERTRLVSLTYVSNVLGSIVPVEQIGRICKEKGILFLVDAAQAAPHLKLDVKKIECDFMAFSGHKMLGPTGIGVLYIKQEHADSMMPAFLGGGTINTSECHCESLDTCNIDACTFSDLPYKWQAGTPPIAETIGLGKAVDYLNEIGLDYIAKHDTELMEIALNGLKEIPGIDIYGPLEPEQRNSIISFNIENLSPTEVGRILNEEFNISVRAGDHCAVNYFKDVQGPEQPPGNVRASFYLYNTVEEVQRFLSAVKSISELARV
ncbi:aminotransferase class V-fold PLP-dependent enzyme [Niallia sp. Krafla_26]|uniref:aminotransferase class V-fold PLP-dependent enzyme n=1 Tax=Niallia sp. Krafla_26 TaxID=3064703 RepID=UPI003D1760DA